MVQPVTHLSIRMITIVDDNEFIVFVRSMRMRVDGIRYTVSSPASV